MTAGGANTTAWTPPVVWEPTPADVDGSQVQQFLLWLGRERGLTFDDYQALWQWSVVELEQFWDAVWHFFDVSASSPYSAVLDTRAMPGARWFDGARLNYAEAVLNRAPDSGPALVAVAEGRAPVEISRAELRGQVGALAAALRELGVGPGDRVAAYLPNIPEAVVALLATASLGAVWTSCAPDFGLRSVIDRLGQVEPTVLARRRRLPLGWEGIRAARRRGAAAGGDAERPGGGPRTVPAPRRAGARGTGRRALRPAGRRATGTVVRAGGVRRSAVGAVLLGHHRAAQGHRAQPRRHRRRAPQVAGPVPGPPPDGHVTSSTARRAGWRGTTWSAGSCTGALSSSTTAARRTPLRMACGRWRPARAPPCSGWAPHTPRAAPGAGVTLRRDGALRLRTTIPTGAPLAPAGWQWLSEQLGPAVRIDPICGGTDVCTAFFGGSPLLPVWHGRDLLPLARGRRRGLRPRRAPGRGSGRGVRRDGADALDAGRLLAGPGRRPVSGLLLRGLPGRLAPGRLDHDHPARQRRRLGPVGRHPEPRRRATGLGRDLRGRGVDARDRRQPRRRSGAARRRLRHAAVRRAGRRGPRGRRAPRPHSAFAAGSAVPAARPRRPSWSRRASRGP